MSSEPKLVLVLNDTHCGSDCALLPERVILDNGHSIGHGENKKLEFLWRAWLDMREEFARLAGADPFTLVLNGDIIEGVHHGTDEVLAAKASDHLNIAKEAIGPFIEMADKVVVTKGTQCHTQDWESVLCREYGLPDAKNFQQFKVNNVLVDVRHHMSCAARVDAESGALAKVMANAVAQCNRAQYETPRVFLRGHRHLTGDYCDGYQMIVVPGAWQYLTRYGFKVVPDSIPRFSAYALDWRNKSENQLPATHRFVYTPPFEVINS